MAACKQICTHQVAALAARRVMLSSSSTAGSTFSAFVRRS